MESLIAFNIEAMQKKKAADAFLIQVRDIKMNYLNSIIFAAAILYENNQLTLWKDKTFQKSCFLKLS